MTPESLARAATIFTQTYTEKNFIGEDERTALVAWAQAMEPHFITNRKGPFRRSAEVRKLPIIDPLFDVVQRRVMGIMGLAKGTLTEQKLGAISASSPPAAWCIGTATQRPRERGICAATCSYNCPKGAAAR